MKFEENRLSSLNVTGNVDRVLNIPEGVTSQIIRINNTNGTVSYLGWDAKKKTLMTSRVCRDDAQYKF